MVFIRLDWVMSLLAKWMCRLHISSRKSVWDCATIILGGPIEGLVVDPSLTVGGIGSGGGAVQALI